MSGHPFRPLRLGWTRARRPRGRAGVRAGRGNSTRARARTGRVANLI